MQFVEPDSAMRLTGDDEDMSRSISELGNAAIEQESSTVFAGYFSDSIMNAIGNMKDVMEFFAELATKDGSQIVEDFMSNMGIDIDKIVSGAKTLVPGVTDSGMRAGEPIDAHEPSM